MERARKHSDICVQFLLELCVEPTPNGHAKSRPCSHDPDPSELERNMQLMQTSHIYFPLSLVAFPELIAPKLLQWCDTSTDTCHFSFTVFAQVFSDGELLSFRC